MTKKKNVKSSVREKSTNDTFFWRKFYTMDTLKYICFKQGGLVFH